jgi:hypothetical protein
MTKLLKGDFDKHQINYILKKRDKENKEGSTKSERGF